MSSNYNGLNFAWTVNNLDDRLGKTGNQCFHYGSMFGCAPECPVFERGECELQDENRAQFIAQGLIEDGDK